MNKNNQVIEEINKLLPAMHDGLQILTINSFEKLIIAGSQDFCYYHNIEIHFIEPSYIEIPPFISDVDNIVIRIASEEEKKIIFKKTDMIKSNDEIFCFDDKNKYKYFIAAISIDLKTNNVYYYKREKLKPGERIASWVK